MLYSRIIWSFKKFDLLQVNTDEEKTGIGSSSHGSEGLQTGCMVRSNSIVALHWINRNGNYKEFIKNRVTKIDTKNDVIWQHINKEENPANIGSRVVKVTHLKLNGSSDGRSWVMKMTTQMIYDITTTLLTESEHEAKKIKVIMTKTQSKEDIIGAIIVKFSSWKTLKRILWILRFVSKCKLKSKQGRVNGLTFSTNKIEASKLTWI